MKVSQADPSLEHWASASDLAELPHLPRIVVDHDDLVDAEQLALGAYLPLCGFMDRETFESVVADHRLPDGDIWTMPIVLPLPKEAAAGLATGARVALCSELGAVCAILDVSQLYEIDLEAILIPWFGTQSHEHPGVARVLARGGKFAAGTVTLVQRLPVAFPTYDTPPAKLRDLFAARNWRRVVGFHGRNLAHRGHEYIQLSAFERAGADGLFINPVVGRRKPGDFLPGLILDGYQAMIDHGIYPRDRVIVGCFTTYARYCGPREAVFTALCRRNMGCTHFIVGRDHTGVGGFYGADDARTLFERLGDIGIEPIFFDAVGYDPQTNGYISETEGEKVLPISGSAIRAALVAGTPVPEWMMRSVVQDVIRDQLAAGKPIFQS